ncbi:hypothetical protein AN1V17_27780 [Vallitalea sediminicola]
MNKSKKNISISLVWILAVIMVGTITIYASYTTLDVTLINQAKSNWCWAACLEMSAKALVDTELDQWDIVKEVKGTSSNSYPNKPGGSSDYKDGMEYITDDMYTASRVFETWTLDEIDDEIDSNSTPIIMSWGYYNSSGDRTGGHANVIYAVDSSTEYLKIKDPGGDGSTITIKYDDLFSSSSKKYDATVDID